MNSFSRTPTVGVGRYAPSPSGDLHLGNLRTALLAWLAARSTHRKFVMRIENLDRSRDNGGADRQLEDLCSIGLDWDDEVVIQTERHQAHQQVLNELYERGLVYECTCSRKDILAAPSAPHKAPGAYPGTCRNKTEDEQARDRKSIAPRRPACRLRSPDPGAKYTFTDLVQGEVTGTVDDVVLQRGDGTIAYNLAVVVDDAAAGVDQIVRGADLASSTARQLLISDLLGYERPHYAHVPLVLGPSGQRLAKRDGAVTLRELEAQGMSTTDVLKLLAESVGLTLNASSTRGNASVWQLLEQFDFSQLPTEPWVFCPES
ncbi:MAG: tRNA glutamyl-Q(34) synthetase GluQRS [Canibacter sp.]